ncbi:MAG: acyl transferase, partial [Bacteroidota bacterium]
MQKIISVYCSGIEDEIFRIENEEQFEKLSFEIFRVQAENNPVYKKFIELQKINVNEVNSILKIPFLPIEFFKTHTVTVGEFIPEKIFRSSGTTGQQNSQHFVKDISLYGNSFMEGFKYFFGSPEDFTFLALLPSYLERNDSSLVYMMQQLISQSSDKRSGFYLDSNAELIQTIDALNNEKKKHILIGVTFALLDFPFEKGKDYSHTIIMETGGMKGRRKEMIREYVHQLLKEASGVTVIHSEYGMTELLSQAYSKGDGKFLTPPWMKVLIREANDPKEMLAPNQSGA